jgi:TrmH family RNA methyltransferase
VITSLKNTKVAQAIRLKKRAFREDDRAFLAEGAQAVSEALEEPGRVSALYCTDDVHPLVARARAAGAEVVVVSEDVMAKLTSTVTPQGLVAVCSFLDRDLGATGAEGCVLVLHEVRDPGNAGTILRSADAAGASGVVFSSTSVDMYNPKAVRASAGSLFHLPVVREADTAAAIETLKARGFRVLAMAADGARDIFDVDLSEPVVFVLGNEAHGLPDGVVEACHGTVKVPQEGRAESLNLAAAATVCLFEWARRRRGSAPDALETIIAAAAHDIRSPLTAMKGFGFALERRWESITDEQRQMMVRGIVYDADRMDTIVRQLVDAARVVAGRLEIFPERVELAKLVVDLWESLRRDPEHPEIVWIGQDATVFVDPPRLRTTLLAFVEAEVWWAREGPIRVDGGVDDGRLWMTVSRLAVDLDDEAAEALFIPRRPGTGSGSKIGLYVARGVVAAQGGRVWASVDDGSLVFHVELPLSV